jgi:hypothetical protein
MSPLFNCVLLGLLATVSVRAQLPGLPGIPGNLLPGLPKLDDLLPCLFKCPCPGATPCVPKLGLDPLVDLSGIEIPIQLNLSCPSLSIEANVCIKLGASCYTSCGTQKTVCDVRIRLCLLTAALKLSLCDPQSLNAHIKALYGDITLCEKYRDAQKYGCECAGATGAGPLGGITGEPAISQEPEVTQ